MQQRYKEFRRMVDLQATMKFLNRILSFISYKGHWFQQNSLVPTKIIDFQQKIIAEELKGLDLSKKYFFAKYTLPLSLSQVQSFLVLCPSCQRQSKPNHIKLTVPLLQSGRLLRDWILAGWLKIILIGRVPLQRTIKFCRIPSNWLRKAAILPTSLC